MPEADADKFDEILPSEEREREGCGDTPERAPESCEYAEWREEREERDEWRREECREREDSSLSGWRSC